MPATTRAASAEETEARLASLSDWQAAAEERLQGLEIAVDDLRTSLETKFDRLLAAIEKPSAGNLDAGSAAGSSDAAADAAAKSDTKEIPVIADQVATIASTAADNSVTWKPKREDIGTFNPDYPDPEDIGMVSEGRDLVYIDPVLWHDNVKSFLPVNAGNAGNAGDAGAVTAALQRHLATLFPTLLRGSASLWWTSELTGADRVALRGDINRQMVALCDRFRPDSAMATAKFARGRLRIEDVVAQGSALGQYVARMLRHARVMGILANDQGNWHGVMHQIWSTMDVDIQLVLKAPRKDAFNSLSEYMGEVRESLVTIQAYGRKLSRAKTWNRQQSGWQSAEDTKWKDRKSGEGWRHRQKSGNAGKLLEPASSATHRIAGNADSKALDKKVYPDFAGCAKERISDSEDSENSDEDADDLEHVFFANQTAWKPGRGPRWN